MLARSSIRRLTRSSISGLARVQVNTGIKTSSIINSAIKLNNNATTNIKRFQSTIPTKPKEIFTNISDKDDPNRNIIFEYTWGTWLKDDKLEKDKRRTKFSIEELNSFLKSLINDEIKDNKSSLITSKHDSNIKILKNNINEILGENLKDFEYLKQIDSIHEGKHHRIYKITTSNDKILVLRIPYKLDTELYIKRKISSEVATMEFLNLNLKDKINIPKVLAYSNNYENKIGSPFILMEYKSGDLLMRQWNPLISGEINEENSKKELLKVINPIADINDQLNSIIFNKFGSIYFKDDLPNGFESKEIDIIDNGKVEGEFVIGPTVEKAYFRNKELIKEEDLIKYLGPWNSNEPLKMIKDLIQLELENFKLKLSVLDSNNNNLTEEYEILKESIKIYSIFLKISEFFINLKPENKSIPNLDKLIKPRIFHPDLDPMNIIINNEKPNLIDFESSCIKPFLFTTYPQFLQYTGPKIFELKKEIENYEELDEIEKQQYEFMFNRTRNQLYWEFSINERRKELLGIISPAIKIIKNSYISALDLKTPKDYLYVENGLIELKQMWEHYNEHGLIDHKENPIKLSEDELKFFEVALQDYQIELSSLPFIATKGWIPQDMFNNLINQKMLIKDENNNYKIDDEKILA